MEQNAPSKKYLCSKWLKDTDEKWSDFITDLLNDEAPTCWVVNLAGERLHKTGIEISDCYFDEAGDLYTPTEYLLSENGCYRDDAGVLHNEDEYYSQEYELFKSAQFLKDEFELYCRDH